MKYLPVGLDVRGRICIVVGGGHIGTRKAVNLLRAGAEVTVVSPERHGRGGKLGLRRGDQVAEKRV